MTRAKIVDHFVQKSLESNFQIDQVRKELEAANVQENEIRIIVKLVDNEVQRKTKIIARISKSNELVTFGIVLSIIGAFITIGTYTGLIDMGGSYFIAYGSFLGGLSLLLTGMTKKTNRNN